MAKKEASITFLVEPELREILRIEAEHRGVRLGTAIRDILWEYVDQYRKTSICDVILYIKQLFPYKKLTEEKIEQAVEIVLRSRKVNDDLELNGEEIEKLKVIIDVGMVD